MIRVDVPVIENGVPHPRKVVEVELSKEALEQILSEAVSLTTAEHIGGQEQAFRELRSSLKTYGII